MQARNPGAIGLWLALTGAAMLLGGCASTGSTPYPAVHDMPAPRADTPMTQDEVKRATADLVTERNVLNGDKPAATGTTTTGSTSAGKKKKKRAAAAKAGAQASGAPANP